MNNYLLVTLAAFMLSTGQASADKDMADLYFSDKNPTLSKQERRALAIANKWKGHNSIGMAPTPGKTGLFPIYSEQNSPVSSVLYCKFVT